MNKKLTIFQPKDSMNLFYIYLNLERVMNLYKKDVIKHSAAIQMTNKITLLQRRAWNVLLANAFDDMDEQEEFKISLADLMHVLKYDSNDIKHLKKTLYDLVDFTVEWNILEKDHQEWGVFALLAEANIINGYCYYSYGVRLRKRLHDATMYARISLSLQNKFKSKYALVLFELFLDYFDVKRGRGETGWIPLEKFRTLVGLEEKEYQQFKDLNTYVIKKPIKEINAITDLCIDLKNGIKTKKVNKRVVALKFIIHKNKKNVIDLETLKNKLAEEETQICLSMPKLEIENQDLLNTLTAEFGLTNKLAVQILKTKDEYLINETLDKIRKQVELSENILNAHDLAVKTFFPLQRPEKPPEDKIEEKLKEIGYHAFKKIRKQHSDEVLLAAFADLDFEIKQRKKNNKEEISNLGGWLQNRLPLPGEEYKPSVTYIKYLKAEKNRKKELELRKKEAEKREKKRVKQEAELKVLNEKIEAKIGELEGSNELLELKKQALEKANSIIKFPNHNIKQLNQLAGEKLELLSAKDSQEIQQVALEIVRKYLDGVKFNEETKYFQTALYNQKIEVVKKIYRKELEESVLSSVEHKNYREKLANQEKFELNNLINKNYFRGR